MKSCWLLILLLFFVACRTHPTKTVEKIIYKRSLYDGLGDYFSSHEITPSIILNNDIKDDQHGVQLGKHWIKWLASETETKISIDDDKFSLRNEVTLNDVWDHTDSVGSFANRWNEMKLYRINGREIILISMGYFPCSGIGCSVYYDMVYDVETGNKSFFGTFRSYFGSALYNFNSRYDLEFLASTYAEGGKEASQGIFTYTIYSMDKDGRFVQEKDSIGSPWQLIHTTFPKDSTLADTLIQGHWFERPDLGLSAASD